jgi:hypothetical protein
MSDTAGTFSQNLHSMGDIGKFFILCVLCEPICPGIDAVRGAGGEERYGIRALPASLEDNGQV